MPSPYQTPPPQRQNSAGEGSCRPPATLCDISLPDGAGRALLRRDVPRGPTCRGRPLGRRRTLSPAPGLCCSKTVLFEIMRMGPNRRPRMRSSSAAVAWTSVGCREAIDGLGAGAGRRWGWGSPMLLCESKKSQSAERSGGRRRRGAQTAHVGRLPRSGFFRGAGGQVAASRRVFGAFVRVPRIDRTRSFAAAQRGQIGPPAAPNPQISF